MPIPTAIRKALKARAGGCCEACGVPDATDAHHRKRKSQGGVDTLSNLLLLCRACHIEVHHSPERAQACGLLVKRNGSPEHIAVRRFDRARGGTVFVMLRDDGLIDSNLDEDIPAWAE